MRPRRAVLGVLSSVALGLASRRIHLGLSAWDKSLGDALYAVMIYFAIALARPRWSPQRLGVAALGASFAVELFQLTGVPRRLPRPLQVALGTTFEWHDVACYFVGAMLVTLGHLVAQRRSAAGGARS